MFKSNFKIAWKLYPIQKYSSLNVASLLVNKLEMARLSKKNGLGSITSGWLASEKRAIVRSMQMETFHGYTANITT